MLSRRGLASQGRHGVAAPWLAQSDGPSAVSTSSIARCPDTNNCVSTEAGREDQCLPAIPFSDSPAAAMGRTKVALLGEKRTTIVGEGKDWLRAECRSFLFRFVDDVHVVVDPEDGLIRFRSASRVGRSDFGVNRRRMMRVSARLVR